MPKFNCLTIFMDSNKQLKLHSDQKSWPSYQPLQDSTSSVDSPSEELEAFANGVFLKFSEQSEAEWGERRRLGRLSESLRLKERLSQIPFHAQRAAAEGESYWLKLAESYQDD